MPETGLIVTLLGLALASAVQAGTGFGFALLAIPFLSQFHSLSSCIVIVALAGGVSTALAWFRDRHHVDAALVSRYCVAAFVGMPIGLYLLLAMSTSLLNALVGVAVLLSIAAMHFGMRLPTRKSTDYGAGLLSGALMTSTGINGPPVVLALRQAGLSPQAFRGSLSVVFTVQRVVAIAMLWLSGQITLDAVRFSLMGIPAIVVGWELGNLVFKRLNPQRFVRVVEAVLVVSGLVCIGRAVG